MDEDEGGFCPDWVLVVPSFCENRVYIYVHTFLQGRCIIWDKMDRKMKGSLTLVGKNVNHFLYFLKHFCGNSDLQLSSDRLRESLYREIWMFY